MAILHPSELEISTLPQKLTEGEQALMNALRDALDDDWIIYVQPHLNGLRPDIIICNPDAGIGIFEVKDWNLNSYRIIDKHWEVINPETGQWIRLDKGKNPLEQVRRYKECLIKYELPELNVKQGTERNAYALVVPFVYFHSHETDEVRIKLQNGLGAYDNVFGCDLLSPNRLRLFLADLNLRPGSKFAAWMKGEGVIERLESAMAYPRHGNTDIKSLNIRFTPKQMSLLNNEPGRRRALGVAGAGKSIILVHKAVHASMEGHKVLLVCFNITMVNYLRDLVTRLARSYGPHIHRNIEVGHYHRIFREKDDLDGDGRYMDGFVDVLLIDEGQDFEREWIEKLFTLCNQPHHVLLVEDDRQNIYERDLRTRRSIPGILGRPNLLSHSFRVPSKISLLANGLMEWAGIEDESGRMEPALQPDLLTRFTWYDSNLELALELLKSEVQKVILNRPPIARPDLVILVCTINDGWKACKVLDELRLPHQRTFESKEENERLRQLYDDDDFERNVEDIRRAYKQGFWMQGGRIKVSTIHSFKGWELSHVFVLFNPSHTSDKMREKDVRLLYTAITRSQQSLSIFNIAPFLYGFGRVALQRGWIDDYTSCEAPADQVRFLL